MDPLKPEFPDRGLNTLEASHVLGMSSKMLKIWRHKRQGPRFHYIGRRIIYLQSDLIKFIKSCPAGGAQSARHKNGGGTKVA